MLITISTPGEDTPICRLGNSEEILGDATVRELIQRVISPNSLFSVGVPMSQLQAETPTALAIGELLSADCCEVVSGASGEAQGHPVSLDEPVRAVAREQVGTQGSRFLNVTLSVCSAPEASTPSGEDRREVRVPVGRAIEEPAAQPPAAEAVAAEAPLAELPAPEPVTAEPPAGERPAPEPVAAEPPAGELPVAELPAPEPVAAEPSETLAETSAVAASAAAESEPVEAPVPAPSQGGNGIVAIVADQIKEEPKPAKPEPERSEYV
ncbi:MAG: hypothetical protein JSV79_04895, partial [Armatimonadota bacterium]